METLAKDRLIYRFSPLLITVMGSALKLVSERFEMDEGPAPDLWVLFVA
jgi:hypothetical protein